MPHPIFETPILHRYRVSVVSVMDHLERLSEGSFGLGDSAFLLRLSENCTGMQ